jgi:hypothetical protein
MNSDPNSSDWRSSTTHLGIVKGRKEPRTKPGIYRHAIVTNAAEGQGVGSNYA